MPNWCEGSLKLKGDPKDIRRFLLERVLYDEPEEKEESLIGFKEITDDEINVDIRGWRWIKDTTRAFLTPQVIWYRNNEVINFDISQAWGFKEIEWKTISKEYHLEVKLYGVECGMMFTDYIYIKDGEIIEEKTDVATSYDEWLWNTPFPYMGG